MGTFDTARARFEKGVAEENTEKKRELFYGAYSAACNARPELWDRGDSTVKPSDHGFRMFELIDALKALGEETSPYKESTIIEARDLFIGATLDPRNANVSEMIRAVETLNDGRQEFSLSASRIGIPSNFVQYGIMNELGEARYGHVLHTARRLFEESGDAPENLTEAVDRLYEMMGDLPYYIDQKFADHILYYLTDEFQRAVVDLTYALVTSKVWSDNVYVVNSKSYVEMLNRLKSRFVRAETSTAGSFMMSDIKPIITSLTRAFPNLETYNVPEISKRTRLLARNVIALLNRVCEGSMEKDALNVSRAFYLLITHLETLGDIPENGATEDEIWNLFERAIELMPEQKETITVTEQFVSDTLQDFSDLTAISRKDTTSEPSEYMINEVRQLFDALA